MANTPPKLDTYDDIHKRWWLQKWHILQKNPQKLFAKG